MDYLERLPWDAAILALAVVLDRFLPEPPGAVHPVVWLGRLISTMERLAPNRPLTAFLYGLAVVVSVVGIATTLAWICMTLLAWIHQIAYVLGGAVLLRTSFTFTGLSAAAMRTRRDLKRDQIDAARDSLRSLVSRDASSLSRPLVATAAIESVAENSTDSFVGPWLAFALLGVPGAIAYRAVNTMDSMIGYRGRYEYLGKAAARLDDLVNLVPARVGAGLLLLGGWLAGCSLRRGWQTMRSDRGRTSSPNAGVTMSAMAGLLGVRLEKPGHYRLGEGYRDPGPDDIDRAVSIAHRTSLLAMVAALVLLAARLAVSG